MLKSLNIALIVIFKSFDCDIQNHIRWMVTCLFEEHAACHVEPTVEELKKEVERKQNNQANQQNEHCPNWDIQSPLQYDCQSAPRCAVRCGTCRINQWLLQSATITTLHGQCNWIPGSHYTPLLLLKAQLWIDTVLMAASI